MERVGIVFDERKIAAKKLGLEIKEWLEKRNNKVFLNLTDSVLEKGLSFVITLGGDGLVLHTADIVAKFNVPLFRINFGRRGFLCDISPDEALKKLQGEFYLEERTRIQAKIFNKDRLIKEIDALNEIVVGKNETGRMVLVEVKAIDKDKNFTAEIAGDGVIFSTETGSTAYHINAGGPVLLADVFSVLANNALFKSDFLLPNTKAIITSTEAVFRVKSLDLRDSNFPYITADNRKSYRLEADDFIEIRKSQLRNLFIKVRKDG